MIFDVAVIGSGPAGAAATLAARQAGASVLLLDRSDFPRDKVCGDAVLGAALRELEPLGVDVAAVTAGYPAGHSMELTAPSGGTVTGTIRDTMTVLPRLVLDARLHEAAVAAGPLWRRHLVRSVRVEAGVVHIDETFRARVVIGADGAESVVRRAVGLPRRTRTAVAIRAYQATPTRPGELPALILDRRPGLAYAWRFPAPPGPANVGYGYELAPGASATREGLLADLVRLLGDVELDPTTVRAHRLPLSTTRQPVAEGPLLLAGDAASLINPVSGEGIYYAVRSGVLAGRAALDPAPAATYRRELGRAFGPHRRGAAVLARLTSATPIMEAGLRAADADPGVFDDLADLVLADGTMTRRAALGVARQLVRRPS